MPPESEWPDYTWNDSAPMHENFHWDDVPAAVIAADDAIAAETPSQIGVISIRSGIIAAEAALIDVPVYVGLGERDVSPAPHCESAFFRNCTDFTLHILPRSFSG